MVVTNRHASRVATVRVEQRLPNRKNKRLGIFVVTPGSSLTLWGLQALPIQVGEGSGSVSISSNLKVEVYL